MVTITRLTLGIRCVFLTTLCAMTSTAWANTLKRATPATPVIVLPTEHTVAQTPTIVNESMPAITPAITTSPSTNTPIALLEVQADTAQPPKTQEQPTYRPQTRTLIPTPTPSRIAPTKHTSHQSLAGLNQFYQHRPQPQGRTCQGVWQYPYPIATNDNLVATANYGYYNAKNYAELSGNAIITQNGRQLQANALHLNPNTGDAHATGQVLFGSSDSTTNNDLMGIAQTLRYNTQTGAMTAHDVAFASKSLSAHAHAQSLSTPTPQSYLMEQALFSTCPPNDRVWHIRAKQLHLDKDTGRGIAKSTTLAIKDVPVFYLPYFNFPLDDRRHSGFLLPRIGINSTDGLQLATPYYLNLAPNYDATITPTFYTNRNPKLSGEFRYLTHFGQGKIDTAYLPKDQEYNHQNRSHLFFEHSWRPFVDKDLGLFAQYRYVSDNRYLSDFDTLGLANNANLPSVIGASYRTQVLTADLSAETFQRLKGTDRQGNPIADKDRPYNRLPQLILNYTLPHHRFGDVKWYSNSAYFKKSIKDGSDSEKSGVRTYNELVANRTFAKSWGYFSPKVALAHLFTSYDEASLNEHNLSKKEGSHSVLLPKVSLDGALYFEKQGSLFGNTGGRQILSPRLKYLYTPYKDQSQMPNFETTIASPSYDQLLADSWFLGYDRIGDLHAITPALSYRYVDTMGNTRFDFALADQFYLDPIQVGLEGTINTKPMHSGLSWQMGIRPSSKLWLTSTGSLDDQHRLSTVAGSLNYQPSADRLFGLGMVKRKENQAFGQLPLHAYTASAILPINERLRLATTTQYDLNHRQFMDTLVGISYEDCCIGVAVYGRQHKNELSPNDKYHRSIMAEVRLNGITGQGRLARLLDEKVTGFEKLTW